VQEATGVPGQEKGGRPPRAPIPEHESLTPDSRPPTPIAEPLAGAAIVVLGGWVLWHAYGLREGPGYAAIGPRVFPVIVGAGFLASGLAVLASGWRSRRPAASDEPHEQETALDWSTLAAMGALLAVYILLFAPLGFIVSSAAFLIAGAWALGSRSQVRDLIVGILLSGLTYVVFTRLLGLELPEGPLAEPIDALQQLIAGPRES
jgi:putative tricarboxylic transport membrane protein